MEVMKWNELELAIRNNNRITSVHSVNRTADQLKHQKDLFDIIYFRSVNVIAESTT